ncbi:protein ROLLING AND ERECT LEAF 2-like [Tripterygium wilfordii]|nr:protein ROLLING AND ERECT LEAF 2-like [Tripterygium wilfordii]
MLVAFQFCYYSFFQAEEKMRVVHDRKCKKLKRLDERGAEAHKVDSTRSLIKSLSTKMRIAIQVVDKISETINKIRDEELWSQLNELIQGLTRMWQGMLECHHTQSQAVREARNLGRLGSSRKLSDAHLEATLQLEHELLNWTFRFSSWIGAHKGYVRALNNWLMKCLLNEPEETEDGRPPLSPGRIGAPPVFVICNQWSQALDRISEKEVVQSMRIFAMSVFQLWEHDKLAMRERMMANNDLERK